MSDSVGSTTMTGRFIASGLIGKATADPNATQRAFNDAYQKWTIKSAVIASQLAAYFPSSDLGFRWRSYANVVTDFLQLSARGQRTDRSAQLLEHRDVEDVQRRIVERDAIGIRVGREFDLRHWWECYRAGARRDSPALGVCVGSPTAPRGRV